MPVDVWVSLDRAVGIAIPFEGHIVEFRQGGDTLSTLSSIQPIIVEAPIANNWTLGIYDVVGNNITPTRRFCSRVGLSGRINYTDRNLIEKWFHTLKMRIDCFHNS